LGLEKDRGSIEQGKLADLFVIKGDPIQDMRKTRTVHTVLCGGKVYKTTDLFKSVEGKLGPKNESESSKW
jgi:imidazolonepropionase-like amidohydrolase